MKTKLNTVKVTFSYTAKNLDVREGVENLMKIKVNTGKVTSNTTV